MFTDTNGVRQITANTSDGVIEHVLCIWFERIPKRAKRLRLSWKNIQCYGYHILNLTGSSMTRKCANHCCFWEKEHRKYKKLKRQKEYKDLEVCQVHRTESKWLVSYYWMLTWSPWSPLMQLRHKTWSLIFVFRATYRINVQFYTNFSFFYSH